MNIFNEILTELETKNYNFEEKMYANGKKLAIIHDAATATASVMYAQTFKNRDVEIIDVTDIENDTEKITFSLHVQIDKNKYRQWIQERGYNDVSWHDNHPVEGIVEQNSTIPDGEFDNDFEMFLKYLNSLQ